MYSTMFLGAIIVLAILICFCLVRAIRGPKIPDRIVAINMIGTMTILIIAILSVMLDEEYLVDICLIYAMISFLAVVVITKVYMGAHAEAKHLAEQAQEKQEEKQE
jgi:multicomponent Na+:H+ antiporter subunit F